MHMTFLGTSGLRVSDLCLGTMTFGTDWGWGADEAESRAVFDAFADAGGSFVDTANAYTNGTSERLLGRFLAGRRDEFVLGTKYTIGRPPGDANAEGNQRKNLIRSLEASLERLGTEYVDAGDADALGCSPAQLAIAWLRNRSPAHIPVVGARSVRHLADNLAAAELDVPAEVAGRLAAASEIELGFPRDFWQSGRPLWYGPHLERLDHRVRPHGRSMMGLA